MSHQAAAFAPQELEAAQELDAPQELEATQELEAAPDVPVLVPPTPLRPFEASELVGTKLAGYQLEQLLGPTELGPVYQAQHPHLAGPRAIKVIAYHFAQDVAFRQQFHEQAAQLPQLQHPHLVKLEAVGEADGLCFVVMEWLPDGSLSSLLQRRGSAAWSLLLALELLVQTVEALIFLQQQQRFHGGLKPSNLLLARRTDDAFGYQVKLADVGLSSLLLASDDALEQIWSDTLLYAMPPERCQGLEVSGLGDQYALGVMLYELATGGVPFEARTLDDAVFHHVYTSPLPPRTVNAALPESFEAIILRCLAKNPAERFARLEDLHEALTALLTHPALAPASTAPAAATKPLLTGPVQPRIHALDQYGRILASLDLTGDGLSIGRDEANSIALHADEIEARQLELDWDGSAIIITSLAQQAIVMVGEKPLKPREMRVWTWDEPLRMGVFWLRAEAVPLEVAAPAAPAAAKGHAAFHDAPEPLNGPAVGLGSPTEPLVLTMPHQAAPQPTKQASSPPPADPPATGQTASDEILSERIGVRLEQESLSLTPGRAASCRVTLINLGTIVDHFTLSVEGIPTHWLTPRCSSTQGNRRSSHSTCSCPKWPRATPRNTRSWCAPAHARTPATPIPTLHSGPYSPLRVAPST
ncbi:FHA domain-containing serine/threonine-protein kinase [Candidatus Viridilinea mediisalina]|uniref:FHA domain-containing serine/threonine-protein kinase n=1 Tax=Candidatus Viridilinea mediisalina TaxID=2024553 RepID=UPI000F591930|nr:FHA domain-containing serine/threonine-protein kinase [Candidatus Viridilinea mediisalina]